MDIVKYASSAGKSSRHELMLQRIEKSAKETRKNGAIFWSVVAVALLVSGKHRQPIDRVMTSISVPVVGMLTVEAYILNSWLVKRYLMARSQDSDS